MRTIIFFLASVLLVSCGNPGGDSIQISGELKQWHEVILYLPGPETSEFAEVNPFLNYRVDVVFSKGDRQLVVPAYFAADGRAGESGAKSGNIWKAHFRPDETGTWDYRVRFREGEALAILDDQPEGKPAGCDGAGGSLEIGESDKAGDDLKGKGRIINGGAGYFRFQESGRIWIKAGTDSPENFLAYADFDQTSRFSLKKGVREGEADPRESLHTYAPHVADWKDGDPTWREGKGKGIIGALNYLHGAGMNSVYMLTMNIIGDGKDVWPYTSYNERYRFDCSKLDQWEVVFDHMETKGMMMHFVLQETENECLLDMGYTGVQRRLYLRELVARFGHHLAVSWNLGEENGPADWTPIGQTDAQKKAMASYLKELNPYPSVVVLHTHADDHHQDLFLEPMLGFEDLDGPSMQIGNPARVHERVSHWVRQSEEAGKRWLVCLDEIGPHWKGVLPDSFDPAHDTVRHQSLWGALMAGAGGVEWYFGYRFPHTDLDCEDFRSRDLWWKQNAHAADFMEQFPLEEMRPLPAPVSSKESWCLAKPGEMYLIYLPEASAVMADLETTTEMEILWYNPREGGELVSGSVKRIDGKGSQSLGLPPGDAGKDWVAVVR